MKYVVLNGDKKPTEKLSNGGHPLEEVKEYANIGMLVPEPYIILDFDSKSDAEIMLQIARDENLQCRIMQTTRGYHFWFKSEKPWKNFKKTRLAIGIYADCRSYGKISYVVVKKDGKWRKWLKTPKPEEVEEVPEWLKPLAFDKYKFKDLKDGDGRNQSLYEYILIMQSKGYNREQIRKAITIINRYVLPDPLDDGELKSILRDESFRDEEEMTKNLEVDECFEDGKFQHHKFSELLVKRLNIVTVNDVSYLYKDGYYQRANRSIDQSMVELFPSCKKNQRAEVDDYIKIITTIDTRAIHTEEYIINLKNTRLDVRTNELLPFDPGIMDFARIPVEYNPDAYCADLDKMLNKVFCHDPEVIDLFDELVGYLLIKNSRFRKGFIFYGNGSNGKSTILNVLKKFIGDENLATVELDKLATDRFMIAELENKIANIGDDIDAMDIINTGTIKKLCTGESMEVQRKYEHPFILKNYAKLIFSCNTLPRIADKSEGMYSRMMFIPFNAVFTADDPDFDPFVEDKVTTPEAMSYLLNRGLRGLRRLLFNNHFTNPKVVQGAQDDYKINNSNVLTWIDDNGLELTDLTEDTTEKLFSDFNDWCVRSNIKYPASIRTFHKEIESKFNLEKMRVRNTETGGKYKFKFKVKLD